MQASLDVQLLGHFRGMYSEGPRQMIFNEEKKWQNFCLQDLKLKHIPLCDFSKREIHIFSFGVKDTGSNYVGMKRWNQDSRTNELFIHCCNVIEEYANNNMGFLKLVITVPRKAKVNAIWLQEVSVHRLDQKLTEMVAVQKSIGEELGDHRFVIGHMEQKYIFSDVSFLKKELDEMKKSQEELKEQICKIRMAVKERLAGPCLNT